MLSIVMPTRNKISRLKLTLAALALHSTPSIPFELILVDDCSDDGTREYINGRKFPFAFTYIRISAFGGRSVARNAGIAAASGDWIGFLDDDCLVDPRYFTTHKACARPSMVSHGAIWNLPFCKFFKDPSNGVLYDEYASRQVERLKDYVITDRTIASRFESIQAIARQTRFELQIRECLEDESGRLPWLSSTGGNIVMKKEALLDAGCFDVKLGQEWGFEDLELGYRLYKNGLGFQYLSDAAVYHIAHYRNNSEELSKKAISYLVKKHPELAAFDLYEVFFSGAFDYQELKRFLAL